LARGADSEALGLHLRAQRFALLRGVATLSRRVAPLGEFGVNSAAYRGAGSAPRYGTCGAYSG